MNTFTCSLLLAGRGARCGVGINKALYKINGKALFTYSLDTFLSVDSCNEVIIVTNNTDIDEVNDIISSYNNPKIKVILGGSERCESSYNGVVNSSNEIVLVHDACRVEILQSDIINIFNEIKDNKECVIASTKVFDTVKEIKDGKVYKTINRDYLINASTPQAVRKSSYLKCYETKRSENITITDEAMLYENIYDVNYYILHNNNKKITTFEDLMEFERKQMNLNNNLQFRIGHSTDTHPLVKGRDLYLGGIKIDYEYGLFGHSDADCVLHAIVEAIIGALGLGDIGTLFPDTDMKYKGMDSKYFLKCAKDLLIEHSYQINNIDCIIYLEKPNLKNYKQKMKETIANILEVSPNQVNIKATRKEGFGMVGRGEVIESECVVLITKI